MQNVNTPYTFLLDHIWSPHNLDTVTNLAHTLLYQHVLCSSVFDLLCVLRSVHKIPSLNILIIGPYAYGD